MNDEQPNVPSDEQQGLLPGSSNPSDEEIAIDMLARWCVAIDRNGTGWDDWDEHYKDASYRPGPLRAKLDAAMAEVRKEYE